MAEHRGGLAHPLPLRPGVRVQIAGRALEIGVPDSFLAAAGPTVRVAEAVDQPRSRLSLPQRAVALPPPVCEARP